MFKSVCFPKFFFFLKTTEYFSVNGMTDTTSLKYLLFSVVQKLCVLILTTLTPSDNECYFYGETLLPNLSSRILSERK